MAEPRNCALLSCVPLERDQTQVQNEQALCLAFVDGVQFKLNSGPKTQRTVMLPLMSSSL